MGKKNEDDTTKHSKTDGAQNVLVSLAWRQTYNYLVFDPENQPSTRLRQESLALQMKLSLFIPFKSITNTRAFLFWSEWLDDLSSCTTSSSPFTLTSWFVAGLHNTTYPPFWTADLFPFCVFGGPIDFGQHPQGALAVRASSKIETKTISWNGMTGRTIFIFPYPWTVADLERVNGNAWRTEWHCLIDSLLVECMLGQPAFHYILAENYTFREWSKTIFPTVWYAACMAWSDFLPFC